MNPDGIIGPKTLALLNQPPRARMEQIVANMERMRWMDQERPDRYVLVNIPQQMLWAVDKGRVAMQMAVVVGQVDRPTKAFKTQITGVRFNPHWTVPQSIKMKDFLPSLQEDRTVLARKGIDLYRIEDGQRVYIDPAGVDWSQVSASDMSRFHMVQASGDGNSLGLIRVLMPNDYDIYLHDTNHRDLFAKNERFFSSGCIRLSDPVSMARFVLADTKLWRDEDMQQVVARGTQKDVMIAHPLQIYITYLTVWPGQGGRLTFGNDIYGQDRQLIGAMDAAHAYWLPIPKAQKTAAAARKGASQMAAATDGRSLPVR
jgi:murein L,D-transpeptidase YcbB/YkuD